MRIISDIIGYTSDNMPKFNSISISATTCRRPARTWCRSWPTPSRRRPRIRPVPRSSRGWNRGNKFAQAACIVLLRHRHEIFFMEAAKPARRAHRLWNRIMTEFGAKSERSKMLRTHCPTSGVSLQEPGPPNNKRHPHPPTRPMFPAVVGGTQSLHPKRAGRAYRACPPSSDARIARNTSLILQEETGVTKVVDPAGGFSPTDRRKPHQ